MSTCSSVSELGQSRHWITDIEISPEDTDPSCKFSARIFVDNELVCNLPWIDCTRSLRWSGLLFCDASPHSKVSLRLCRSVKDKHRYFNFPSFAISEVDEETGESTLELPEAAWVVTIKFLTPATAEQLFPAELNKFNAIEGAYGGLEQNNSGKSLFQGILHFAALVVEALPECSTKVSFLIYMKAWELLDQQTQLHDTLQAVLHGLARISGVVDIASHASSSTVVTSMNRSKEPISGILALLEDMSVYVFNQHTTNDLARIPVGNSESNDTYNIDGYLVRFEDLQRAFYASWSPADVASPTSTSYASDIEPSDGLGNRSRAVLDEITKADWYEVLNLLRPVSPNGYDPDWACLDGTREAVLNRIIGWTQNCDDSDSFMWISGQAGMGKTSIATSLCQRLDHLQALAGSFFYRRDDSDSNDPLILINNLVCDLSMACPTYAHEVATAIRANPRLCSSRLSLRYQGLVKGPLKQLRYLSMPMALVVVVDGLDECSDEAARGKAIQKLYEISRLVPWLKVICTSRPVGDLQKYFQANCPHSTTLRLQEYDAAADIRAYIEAQLGELAKAERWPNSGIDDLCAMSQGVFLWAALSTKYIKDLAYPALPRLRKLLDNKESPVMDHFDALYTSALKVAFGDNEDETKSAYLRCIGSIVATSGRESLTASDLQYLFLVAGQIDQLMLDQLLRNLAPLLLVLDGGHIEFIHASFKDFITSSSRSGEFYIQLDQCEADPAASCLKLMKRDLRFNICELETSHLLNSEVPDLELRIQSHIAPTLEYSSVQWVDHFISSPSQAVVKAVREFLEGPTLMYWIEVLSLLGRLDTAVSGLYNLASLELTQFSDWSLITPWLKDAHRFLVSFYDAISASTPHLYVSALAFAPSKSPTAHRMRPYFPNTVTIARDPGSSWHPCVKTTIHPQAVQTLSVSPDGFSVVVGYPNGSLAVWDIQNGARISESLVAHEDSVACVTFSPSGDLIASGSYDTTIRVWDVVDGIQTSHVLTGHSGVVHAVAFSPDAAIIASGSSDKTIRLWDPKTMCPIQGPYSGHSSAVSSLAFSFDGTKLVSGSWDNTVRVWAITPGSQQLGDNPLLITGHSDSVTCVAISPDGSQIASGSVDKTVQMWNSQTGQQVESCTPPAKHSESVTSVAFSSDGGLVVSASSGGVIHMHDAATLDEIVRPFGHSTSINGVAFSPDGAYVVSGSTDMTTRIWEITPSLQPMATDPLVGHSAPVYCVAISSDGTLIASGSGDHSVRMWDAQTGAAIGNPYLGHSSFVYSLAFFLGGTRLVSGAIDMTLKLWDTTKHALIESYSHHSKIRCVAASPDGSLIAFGSDDEQVYLWEPMARKITNATPEGLSGLIWSLAFSPDGAYLASAAGNKVSMWDTKTHTRVGKLITGHTKPVRSIAFSPCGTRLVSGSDDNTVRLWDPQTGDIVLELTGHSNHVVSVAYSPDGSCIASASFDNTIRLWNSKTGRIIGEPLAGHSKRLRCLTFSPDGCHLVSGSDDNTVRVWGLDAYFRQANDTEGAFCWPANPYELSSHPHYPGWVTHDQKSLAFWLPPHHLQPEHFRGISPEDPIPRTFLDYSKFVHGAAWTTVASDPSNHS